MSNSKLAHVCFALWFVQCGSPASNPATGDQCADGQWDGQETDVDCGGPTCRACDYHKVCATDRDCQTGYCLPIKVCGFPPMTLTAVAPAQGPLAGGTVLTLTGTNFQNMNGISVSVAGVAATSVAVKSATQLTATTGPRMAIGLGDVVITAPDYNTATLAKSFTYYYGPLSFGPASTLSTLGQPSSVVVGDFNGDTKPDLAVGIPAMMSGPGVAVLLGNGMGGFGTATTFSAGSDPGSMVVADFNGDKKADLAFAATSFVRVLLGNGMGGFGTATAFSAGSQPRSIVVGDFNGDTKADLAVANQGSDNVSVLLGNGAGGFGSATNFPVGAAPSSVVVGDFNGDTKADLAVANLSGSVSVLLGDGTGGFGSATNFPAGNLPFSMVVGDFNGDMKADLAVVNSGSDSVSVLLGNGTGGFGTATNFPAGSQPGSVVVGDFNGDTKPDLAVVNTNPDNVSVLLGNGTGGFGSATNFLVGSKPGAVAVGDVNGDTKPDLVVVNGADSSVSVLLNTSN